MADIAEVLSWPGMADLFTKYSLEFLMIKDVDEDVIIWCNDAAARVVNARSEQVSGSKSIEYFPAAAGYREDDIQIVESGKARVRFLEVAGGSQILTTKVPYFGLPNRRCVMIFALNCDEVSAELMTAADRGTVYSYTAMASAKEAFKTAQRAFERTQARLNGR